MNYLLVENVSKSFGVKEVLRNLTFGIEKGQKVALVARNGTGKTTLLKIISGKDTPDEGKIVTRNGIRIGFLEQDPPFNANHTVWESIFQNSSNISETIHDYETALKAFDVDKSPANEERLSNAMQQMDLHRAWDVEVRVNQILGKLKIYDTEQKINELSGGQLKRVALAAVLIDEPDMVIMDEPTNHLDVEMIEWLEDYLSGSNMTLLMVTHDRYFLDNVCSDVYELDNQKIYQYHGDYAYFLEKKAEREAAAWSEVDKAQNLYHRELEWVRKQPKARTTKSKSRVDAFDEIKEKAFSLKKKKEIEINMRMKHMGNKILELINVSKSFGDKKLIEKFTYSFRKGERIGIVGNNGTGKSTLLKMITGKLGVDAGKVVVGETIEFGNYNQEGIALKDDKRVIEVIRDIAEVIEVDKSSRVTASQMLQRFDFSPDMQYNFVSKLSGGEKRRLYLLTVLLRNPNFLILDEPTNDLDIVTLNKLEEYLENFPGCIIIVSHDRYFMDKIVDQIFVFEGNGKVEVFGGNYTEYRIKKQLDELEAKNLLKRELVDKKEEEEKRKADDKKKTKFSFKEKLEFEQLENDLPKLEQEKAELTQQLSTTIDHEALLKITDRLGEVVRLIDEKTDRWLVLSEYQE
jgi:ATP-binding cassette subfamily F protein uup